MISLIHPSRGRPEKALETFHKWTNNNPRDEYYYLSLDKDDPLLDKYMDIFPDYFSLVNTRENAKIIVNSNRSAVDAINNAAKQCYGTMIVVSDDTEPCNNWHYEIEQIARNNHDWILKTYDGIQPWIITMPVMDHAYYRRFGYIYNPGYAHLFCDTELTCVADLTGRKIESKLLFKHNHYSVTKEQPDAVNKKADATWAQGEKLFLERYKRNFDLPPDQIKGKIQDNGMINWLMKR